MEGLSNVLVDNLILKTVIVNYSECLDILTCGVIPPNPSEILSSNKIKQLLEALKEDYDNIILDSPPLISVADAQILSTYSDGHLQKASR